ncbi:MAG: hypothetical protein WA885_03275 [Phormidesmis sp.]
MSENSSPQPVSDSQDRQLPDNQTSDRQSEDRQSEDRQSDLWETVDLPGTVSAELSASQGVSQAVNQADREKELLALIHDLNECNDVLLARISQLENRLNQSEAALATELERARQAEGKMAERVSAQQASVQQVSQTAQQQIARLIDELETAQQSLSRQQLIHENLQTELGNAQERTAQLERECALIAQQQTEQTQARIEAENSNRDLRSRLQRQQRYTLQFKAALEKSLTVSPRSASAQSIGAQSTDTAQPFSFKASVVLPKAQRIMPWAGGVKLPFAGIDPHLESLIRGAGKPSEPEATAPLPITSPVKQEAAIAAAPEAEAKLWQDLERVTSSSEKEPAQTASSPSSELVDAEVTVAETTVAETTVVKETAPSTPVSPKLNWQSRRKPAESVAKVDRATDSPEPAMIPEIEQSFVTATHQTPEPEVEFTEPSPWDQPLPETTAGPLPADYLPAVDGSVGSAISPMVKPLRSPKKISSLAAVELPTFPKAKVTSFQR